MKLVDTLKKNNLNLSPNEALVLQQVHEDGADDISSLSKMLGMSKQHILTVISNLKSKGLVSVDAEFDGLWVQITSRGGRLMRFVWPEAHGYAK